MMMKDTNPQVGAADIALKRAITLLDACGVKYAILKDDGTVIGQLAISQEKKVIRKPRVNNFIKEFPGYTENIRVMKYGEILRWVVGTDRATQFQSAVTGHASRIHGAGTFISTRTGLKRDTIELMLVGK